MAWLERFGFEISKDRVSTEITFDGVIEVDVGVELADLVGKSSECCQ